MSVFGVILGPHFPAFGLNTERYGVSLRIQSECGKMRTRIIPNTDTFYAVYIIYQFSQRRQEKKESREKVEESRENRNPKEEKG